MERFIDPNVTTLILSRGDTLTVRTRLNTGEYRAMLKRCALPGSIEIDPAETGIAMAEAYLLDWTLTRHGKPVPIAGLSIADLRSVLDATDPVDFNEIKTAIERHVIAMATERDREKNSQDGATNTSAISPSPGILAGV